MGYDDPNRVSQLGAGIRDGKRRADTRVCRCAASKRVLEEVKRRVALVLGSTRPPVGRSRVH